MKFGLISQKALNVLSGALAMAAQRLPFLKNLSPLLGAGRGIPFAAPLSVTFVGTHSLSGQSITIVPVAGSLNPATTGVGQEFQWAFKSGQYEMESVRAVIEGTDSLPDGLAVQPFVSGIYLIFGIPTTPGEYAITITGYREPNFASSSTAPYTLNLTVEGDDPPLSPFEEFAASFWQGDDLANLEIAGPMADPDKDGIENQLEFVLNLDPTKLSVMPGTIEVDPENADLIRYSVPLNVLANAVSVKLEEAPTLGGDWTEVTGEGFERTDNSISVTAPRDSRRFYRLRVSLD